MPGSSNYPHVLYAPESLAPDAVASPVITVDDLVVGESDGTITVTVRLSDAGQNTVTVNYSTSNATASGSGFTDVTGVSGTLTFLPGETSKTVQIAITDNTVAELIEHFRFNLSGATNSTLGKASAMVSIIDDDTVVDTPLLFVRDAVIDESAGTASFVVLLGGPNGQASNSTVTVDYATADGTATAGSDYSAKSGTLSFAPGETVKTVTVNITDDAQAEGLERFYINLSNAGNATILDGEGRGDIGANDSTAVAQPRISVADVVAGESDGWVDFVVSLSAPGQTAVSVNYVTGNATASGSGFVDVVGVSGTLNFLPGETVKSVRIELTDNLGAESFEHFTFSLSGATNATVAKATSMIAIVDDDTVVDTPRLFVRDVSVDEKDGTASFVVMLGGPNGESSNSTVSVNYTTVNGSAKVGSDYAKASGTLYFAPGETVKTVVVDISDDTTVEGIERFALKLSNAINATILDGEGHAEIGASDGTATATPQLSVADIVTSETDGYVDVPVRLSSPGQSTVTVNYATANATASGSSYIDVVGVSGTLSFAPGETLKVVRMQLTEFQAAENFEHFTFSLSGATNATIAKATAMIGIVDSDSVVDTPSLYIKDAVVDEGSGTASFVVMLGGPNGQSSNSTVTVDYATGYDTAKKTDLVATSGTLVFASGETAKTIVVDLRDSGGAEGTERFSLELSNAVNATIVDGVAAGEIRDNDAAATATPVIGIADWSVSEGDGYFDMVVSLSAPGQSAVSVNYSTANGTASGSGFADVVGVSGTLRFLPGETTQIVRIQLTDNLIAENNETFTFSLSGASNASIGTTTATITIIDNDNGIDVFSYGISDDSYTVDSLTDVIVENVGGGTDLVRSGIDYTLGANLENLKLTDTAVHGTGNELDNYLRGSNEANLLLGEAGNDTLEGLVGNDTMFGGDGDDTYLVNSSGDVVTELLDAGYDTVRATFNYTLGQYFEKLVLLGSASRATGNNIANKLVGTGGDDILNGRAGKDTMVGGQGNDVFIADSSDLIVEKPGGGTDLVKSSTSIALNDNIENLLLTGRKAADGIGNGENNDIHGNNGVNSLNGRSGDDIIAGANGNDILRGGAGADAFVFDTALSATKNLDHIADFENSGDLIQLSASVFSTLSEGVGITAQQFLAGPGATAGADADDRLVYDTDTGTLYYDPDGSGALPAVAFAVLDGAPTIGPEQFIIVG